MVAPIVAQVGLQALQAAGIDPGDVLWKLIKIMGGIVVFLLILVFFALFALLLYINYYYHIQWATIGHTEEGFEDWVSEHVTNVLLLFDTLQSGVDVSRLAGMPPSLLPQAMLLRSQIAAFRAGVQAFNVEYTRGLNDLDAFVLYYKYYDPIRAIVAGNAFEKLANMYSANDPVFKVGDVNDPRLVAGFKRTVWDSLERVRRTAGALSAALHRSFNTPGGVKAQGYAQNYALKADGKLATEAEVSTEAFDAITAVHLLRLYLNDYHEDIERSYATRRPTKGFNTNLITFYGWPTVKNTFTRTIPQTLLAMPRNFQLAALRFQRTWSGIGKVVARLPLTLAKAIAAPKHQVQSVEMYLDEKHDLAEERDQTKKEVKEGFLQPLIDALNTIVEFFVNLVKLAMMLLDLLMQLLADPIGTIFKILMMIVGMLIGLALMLVYIVLSIPPLPYLYAYLYAFIIAIVGSILYCVFVGVLAIALLLAFCGPLWLLDLLTRGAVLRIFRCENLPDAWETRNSLVEGNIYRRLLLCSAPCRRRYKPVFGVCARLNDNLPDHCPHQHILSIFKKGDALGDPYVFDRYLPNPRFATRQKPFKENALLNAFELRTDFLTKCMSQLRRYDYVNAHICAGVAAGLVEASSENRAKYGALCKQAYCDHEIVKKSGLGTVPQYDLYRTFDGKYAWCSVFERDGSVVGGERALLKRTVFLMIVVMVLLVVAIAIMSIFGAKRAAGLQC